MAALYFILGLLIQNSLSQIILDYDSTSVESGEARNATDIEPTDWIDALFGSSSTVFPTASVTLISQATSSEKLPKDKLEDIKETVSQISSSLESEMVSLLSDALAVTGNGEPDNNLRKKRSIESPMDSTQLVMRLLKHIKSNNEYQNIAIEKMMSAQQIADKFGISFTPDQESLSDLAAAASEQAKELSAILTDAFEFGNVTKNTSEESEETYTNETLKQNEVYQNNTSNLTFDFDIVPEDKNSTKHQANSNYNFYNYSPVETQIVSPAPQYSAPVSQRPNFYDLVSDNHMLDNYCSMEPATATIIISDDEPVEAEPELVAEEFEETVSSKVIINHEEAPDVSTVNHVTSYTISEKAHFRRPHIDSLPQQMQYYFLLI